MMTFQLSPIRTAPATLFCGTESFISTHARIYGDTLCGVLIVPTTNMLMMYGVVC
jgi:hypothetical protein